MSQRTYSRRLSTDRITHWITDNASRIVALVVVVGLWEIFTNFITTRSNQYYPSIEFIVTETLAHSDLIIEGAQVTILAIVIGFMTAVAFGIFIGTVLAESFLFRQLSLPIVIFSYSMPHGILAPIFFIWFGTGLQTVIAFVTWSAFFNVFVTTLTGMASVDREFYYLADTLGATRWQVLTKIKFWAALPHITTGIKLAAQASVVATVIAEFIAAGAGLGFILVQQGDLVSTGLMFGDLILLIIIAIVWYSLISRLLKILVPPVS